jgi:hypothetical protein
MLVTSLCPGRNSTIIQWDTMRETKIWISNAHDAGREYLCETVMGLDRTKQYVTSSHTFGKWFSHFMQGARLRMGMIRKQNEALTSTLALAVCGVVGAKWSEEGEDDDKLLSSHGAQDITKVMGY